MPGTIFGVCLRRGLAACAAALWLALPSLALPSLAAAAGAAAPSFDCKAARSRTEKAICADPALATLDRRVAEAYRTALARLDAPGKAALKEDQVYFLQARDIQAEREKTYELGKDLAWRAQFLETLDPAPRTGFAGRWANVSGEITVAPKAGGGLTVDINTVQPYPSYPTCTLTATAAISGDALIVGGGAEDLKENEGWTVRLTRAGAALKAELVPSKTSDYASPPFCGFRTSIDGRFLPARLDVPRPVPE